MKYTLYNISKKLLFEQTDNLSMLRTSIIKRRPITIDYAGPSPEVLSGKRFDIEPVVLGTNIKSGNLVIWAYVFKGTSKKGLPGWKMFRVDRIQSVEFNPEIKTFMLSDLPGYEKGKAVRGMKSLGRVDVFSPYWAEEDRRLKKNRITAPPIPPKPEPQVPEPEIPEPEAPETDQDNGMPNEPIYPIEQPGMRDKGFDVDVYNELKPKIKDIKGEKILSKMDYDTAVNNLYSMKQGEWKNYQRMVSGSSRPGEGTRNRFQYTAKSELDKLLSRDNVKVSDISTENLSESYRRFKRLILS